MSDPANQNKDVLLATAYLPPISWFREAARSGSVFIESHETYAKQTFRNRCQIYSANGKYNLTIPVTRPKGNHTPTSEVLIVGDTPWKIKHWRAIESAYNSSPWFLYYKDEIYRHFSENKHDRLFDFNLDIIETLFSLIGMSKEISRTKEFVLHPGNQKDYRALSHPGRKDTVEDGRKYTQVFETKFGFIRDLSIIDLLFNLGPETKDFLIR